jgi:hypothetical protein
MQSSELWLFDRESEREGERERERKRFVIIVSKDSLSSSVSSFLHFTTDCSFSQLH